MAKEHDWKYVLDEYIRQGRPDCPEKIISILQLKKSPQFFNLTEETFFLLEKIFFENDNPQLCINDFMKSC